MFFFFFQEEDGIRDVAVTGVQTCALPICPVRGVLRGGVLPVVAVNGLPGPDVALTAAAGMEYRSGSIAGGLFYELERYDFPDVGTGRRLEQVTKLTFRFTVRRGGRASRP